MSAYYQRMSVYSQCKFVPHYYCRIHSATEVRLWLHPHDTKITICVWIEFEVEFVTHTVTEVGTFLLRKPEHHHLESWWFILVSKDSPSRWSPRAGTRQATKAIVTELRLKPTQVYIDAFSIFHFEILVRPSAS